MFGLGEEWHKVVSTLRRLSNVYDRLNHVISFGRDWHLRMEAVRKISPKSIVVLDAGAGNGAMSKCLLNINSNVELIVMLDFLSNMLKTVRMDSKKYERVVGIFEAMPIRSNSIDAVLMGFSLRDSLNMSIALVNIFNVLKPSGEFLILDLGKPDSILKRIAVAIYWMIIAPILAFLRLGRNGLLAFDIYRTFIRLPTNRKLIEMLGKYFSIACIKKVMIDGVLIVLAKKS